jgi:hypothetical protein
VRVLERFAAQQRERLPVVRDLCRCRPSSRAGASPPGNGLVVFGPRDRIAALRARAGAARG